MERRGRQWFLTKLFVLAGFRTAKRSIKALRNFHERHGKLFASLDKKRSKLLGLLSDRGATDHYGRTLL